MKTYILDGVECAAVDISIDTPLREQVRSLVNDLGPSESHICFLCPRFAVCPVATGEIGPVDVCHLPSHMRLSHVAVPLPLFALLKLRAPVGTFEEPPCPEADSKS
jgi:hypothetical protein